MSRPPIVVHTAMPAEAPRPPLRVHASRSPAAGAIIRGEQVQVYDGEPTSEHAAALLRKLASRGTVDRLDLVHGALLAAFRAGRAAEQADVASLAQQHAGAFLAAVVERGQDQAAHDALPWPLQ